MQQFIASYLFQNKTCPLPGLGTLSISNSGAEADFSNKLIGSPKSVIHFTNEQTDADTFLNYVANSTDIEKQEVTDTFNNFCDRLKKEIDGGDAVAIEQIGKLTVDAQKKIKFEQQELPVSFVQPVFAERVIHPQSEHQILVGDRETTNTVMTEFLAPKEALTDRWWIWAIVLGAIGLGLLFVYFSGTDVVSMFGNATKI